MHVIQKFCDDILNLQTHSCSQNHGMNLINLIFLLSSLILTIYLMGKKNWEKNLKNHTLVVDSGCIQCFFSIGFTIEKLHGKRIQAAMDIAGTEPIELEAYDAYAKTYVLETRLILLIKNGLYAT